MNRTFAALSILTNNKTASFALGKAWNQGLSYASDKIKENIKDETIKASQKTALGNAISKTVKQHLLVRRTSIKSEKLPQHVGV